MARRYPAIDLLKLYSKNNSKVWNAWLTACHKSHRLQELARIRYGIQAGMDDLTKKKMNTNEMVTFFLRLNRSIEETAKKIIREKYPSANDNPNSKRKSFKELENKKKRDFELENFLKESAY